MDSTDKVLKDLAAREQALSARVDAAREEAQRILLEADAKAASILAEAEARARALAEDYRARQAAEESAIREASLAAANAAAGQATDEAGARVSGAVKLIVERVLP